jgi:hypothetical protein
MVLAQVLPQIANRRHKTCQMENEQVKHCLELVEPTIYGQKPSISFTTDQSVKLAFMMFTRL